ncbi:hypothetical protein [Aquimarina rhabdastrellae]
MLESIQNLGSKLTKKEQQEIQGGVDFETCAACFDDCVRTSADRAELAICFNNCQLTSC